MTTDSGEPRGGSATRSIVFYAILAAVTIAVVVIVFNQGTSEKAMPPIAGGYAAAGPAPCLGPVPAKPAGKPLPPTAPAQPPMLGPLFNVLQSGQFVNLTNNQNTLGGQLRLDSKALANGGHKLTGTVDCVNGGSQSMSAVAVPGA